MIGVGLSLTQIAVRARAAGTASGDEDVAKFSISGPSSIGEGNSGTTNVNYNVTRSGYTVGPASVDWAASGTVNASDFVGAAIPSGTLNFADGDTDKTITIQIQGDTTVESDEMLTVTLSNALAAGMITTASASTTIVNDDTVSAPANSVAPVISYSGGTYSTTNGTWSNTPTAYAYQWRRNGAAISGETASTYVTSVADAGASITCRVTASNIGGSNAATSNAITAADYFVTDGATMLSAFSAATSGMVIEFRADIPAPATPTRVAVVPGVTVRTDGVDRTIGTAAQAAGYSFECDASAGQSALTTFGDGRLTLFVANSYAASGPPSAYAGILFVCGNVRLDMKRVSGDRGAGVGGSQNVLCLFMEVDASSSTPAMIADIYGQYDTSGGDIISSRGYGGFTGTVTQNNPASRVTLHDTRIFGAGSGGIDNWVTCHSGLAIYAYGGYWTNPGGGPPVNHNPSNGTCELYGVRMDITSTVNYSGNSITCTKMVGCIVEGTPAAADTGAAVRIYGDPQKPTERSCCIKTTSTISILSAGTLSKETVFARNTHSPDTSKSNYVCCGDYSGSDPTMGSLLYGSTFNVNSSGARQYAVQNRIAWPVMANCDLNSLVASSSGIGIRPATGRGIAQAADSWKWTGSTTANAAAYDNASSTVTDFAAKTTNATLLVNGTNPALTGTAVNCTSDGSTPPGASVGTAGRGGQLQGGVGASMWTSVEAYLSANVSGRGAGVGFIPYTSVDATMAAF